MIKFRNLSFVCLIPKYLCCAEFSTVRYIRSFQGDTIVLNLEMISDSAVIIIAIDVALFCIPNELRVALPVKCIHNFEKCMRC